MTEYPKKNINAEKENKKDKRIENTDTLIDFLPVDKQVFSDYEKERLKSLINESSPYRKED